MAKAHKIIKNYLKKKKTLNLLKKKIQLRNIEKLQK